MEVKEHAKIYNKAKWFLAIFTLVVAVAAFVFASYRTETYKVAVSFDVNLVNRAETVDYQYGAYYDLKGSEIFTQHVMSWLMTPAVIAEIYDEAGQSYEIDNLSQFTSRFNSKQYSAQNFYVTFTEYNPEQGEKIGQAMGKILEEKAPQANSAFALEASEPVVVKQELNPWTAGVVGLIVGFILSITLVYLREYFRE